MKHALFFGMNYKKKPYALQGCVNDSKMLAEFFRKNGFSIDMNIDSCRSCMLQKLNDLVELSNKNPGLQAIIQYSGHGTQVKDTNGDEADGLDECLCPYDVDTAGVITDDELKSIVSKLHPNSRVIFLIDACHSGSILDLKNTDKIPVICISSCTDEQTSEEKPITTYFGGHKQSQIHGDMTMAFMFAQKFMNESLPEWLKKTQGFLNQLTKTQKIVISGCNFTGSFWEFFEAKNIF